LCEVISALPCSSLLVVIRETVLPPVPSKISLTVISTNFALVKKKNVENTTKKRTINIFNSEKTFLHLIDFEMFHTLGSVAFT
jgi:hypothetical protein